MRRRPSRVVTAGRGGALRHHCVFRLKIRTAGRAAFLYRLSSMSPHDTLLPGQKPCTQAKAPTTGTAAAKPAAENCREPARAHDLPVEQLPAHLAIIMDGNGRWAQARNLPREAGHKAGAETVSAVVGECRRLGIRHLTLYTFSSENWNRPKAEISALFSLLLKFLRRELPRLEEQGIALKVMGDLDGLPLAQRTALRHAIKRTANGPHMVLNLALNYGSRAELVRAMQSFLHDGARPEDITEASLAQRLYTAGQPDPDLLIRTSGEQRLSNYLLYQCAYSELYFTQVAWPDFDAAQLRLALEAYAARSRRFGKTQEQIDAH